ncbi:MAG: hypothetical protein EXR35_08845 [Limnohabitans sp.]|nr:hypothetical protein [Limnohabitans sp.]
MHDGIELEALGIPTAVIVTKEFVSECVTQRAALGMPGLEAVVVDHPLSSCTDEEVRLRARQAAEQVISLLQAR